MQHLRLQSITYFNMMTEVILRKVQTKWFCALRDSKVFSTLVFMLCSGGIMHCLQKGDINQFWLITPTKVVAKEEMVKAGEKGHYCSHEKSCWKFIAEVR
jgi:hypothetical protein